MLTTYAKWEGMDKFRAFDLSQGVPVKNIIYASCYSDYNLEKAQQRLQEICNENKNIGLQFRLVRDSDKKVMWESA